MKAVVVAVFTISTLFSIGANAACSKPEAPALPDADTAVTAEMVKAKNDIGSYMTDANAYLDCVNNTRRHNAMVDEMTELGNLFNSIVRNYKARKSTAAS